MKIPFSVFLLFLLLLLAAVIAACSGSVDVTPSREITQTTAAPTTTRTTSPTPSPIPPTASPTITYTKTPSPTTTRTPTSTRTTLPSPTATLLPLPELVTNGSRDLKMVALTFDICEDPDYPSGYETGIEWYLNLTDTPATFFISGHWMPHNAEIVQRLAENPLFEIGNHSWSHPDFRELESWEIKEELEKTNNTFFEITGKQMALFRFPAGTYYPWILGEIRANGMIPIQWDVVTADPVPDNDAENILRIVQENTTNGSIIIMHANGRGWHTAEALPLIVEWLEQQGYEMVTISTLLEASGYDLDPAP